GPGRGWEGKAWGGAGAPRPARKPTSAGTTSGVIARTVTTTQPAIRTPRASAPIGTAAARNSNVVAARRIDIFILLQCAVSQYVSGCRAGAYGTMQAPGVPWWGLPHADAVVA